MNYKDRCRTCLGKSKEMRHIHATILIAGNDVRLSDILQNFYDYQVNYLQIFTFKHCTDK